MENNKKTILLVEDEVITAMLEQKQLQEYGYNVIHCSCGEDAINQICEQKLPADLILMDIDLGNGIDGTVAARKILEHVEIPVVFLSSHTEPEIVEKTEEITSYGYVVKSSSITVLDASIKMAFKLFKALLETREKEEALHESMETAEKYLNVAAEIIISLDKKGNIALLNDNGHKLLGWERGELIGKNWFDACLLKENIEEIKNVFSKIMSGNLESVITYENDVITKSGKVKTILWHNSILFDSHGEINGLLSSGEDITSRKRIEDELFAINTALTLILNTVPQSIFWKDAGGRYLGCNSAFAKAVGMENTKSIIGKTDFDLPWPREEAEAYRADDRTVLESNLPKMDIIEPLEQADGTRLWIKTSKAPLCDKNGSAFGVLGIYEDITKLRQNEEALLETSRRFRELFDGSRDGFVVVDEKGRILMANGAFCSMLGYELKELQEKEDFYAITQERWRKWEHDEIWENRLLKTGVSGIYEKEYIRKDGTIIPVELQSFTVNDEQGKIRYLWGVVRDITERRFAEDKLQTFIDSAGSSIGIYDNNLYMTGINRTGLQWWPGKTREDVIGKHITELVPDVDPELLVHLRQVIATGKRFVDHQHIPSAQFGELIMEFEAFKMPDGVAILTTDITERKRMEEELRDSRELLQTVIDNSQYFIYAKDLEGRFILASRALADFFSQPRTGLLGKTSHDFLQKESADQHWENDCRVMELKQLIQIEETVVTPDGVLSFLTTKFPLFDSKGRMYAVCGVSVDITRLKRAEEEIIKQLSEKENILKEVHHRIKNNFSLIEGFLLLQADASGNADVKISLQDAITRIQCMRIVYDKLMSGQDYKEVSVEEYIESLVDSIAEVFTHVVKVEIEKRIVDFNLNSKKLIPVGIIINELLTNVYKYAFTGRNSGHILITLDKIENQVTLTIRDNGNGFDENFDMSKSHGFGLSMVKLLAEQLNGTYSIENSNGTISILKFNI